MTSIPIKRALLSVSDKTGIVDLGKALASHGVELVSTGGTATALRAAGLDVRDVSELTGFPEMMDGRVKTLHPMVHGGLLAVRDDSGHAASMAEHQIGAIDLVIVNLYPFEATVAKGADRDTIIENIDIGGPSMVRSAAKNHAYVAIVTDPADYALVSGGTTTLEDRKKLAAKAFATTAAYDSAIATWFGTVDQAEEFPATLPITLKRGDSLRYGENPHQSAAFYTATGSVRGIGAGQMNRLESARIAAWKAKDAADKAGWSTPRTIGSAVASDAFFPFADGLLAAVEAGATAVIQPGGSIRDADVIAAADEAGLAMVFTGMRHFRH